MAFPVKTFWLLVFYFVKEKERQDAIKRGLIIQPEVSGLEQYTEERGKSTLS